MLAEEADAPKDEDFHATTSIERITEEDRKDVVFHFSVFQNRSQAPTVTDIDRYLAWA